MVVYQSVIRKESPIENTLNIKKLVGQKVLSKGGTIIGYVSEIRINPDGLELEGVVVSRDFSEPIYIGRDYFSHLSDKAVILNIELSILVNGKKVITSDGKLLGKVKQVNRRGNTNEIESILVSSFWKKYLIPEIEIKQIKDSVLIKDKYDEAKNYIWKRPQQDSNL